MLAVAFLSFVLAGKVAQVDPALGEADLAPAFGNTLRSTYPDGRTARMWLEAGGRYSGTGRRGQPSSGVWRVDRGQLCFSQRRPIPMPIRYCTAIVRATVGSHWTARAVTGETIRVDVIAGR